MGTRQTKEVWGIKGEKRENSEQNIIIAEHFQILTRKRCPELTKVENNSYENRRELGD